MDYLNDDISTQTFDSGFIRPRDAFKAISMATLAVVVSSFLQGVTVQQASASTITTFVDRTAFETAAGTFTIEDFTSSAHFPISSGILNSSSTDAGLSAGEIKAGVTYSTAVGAGNFFNIDAGGGFVGGFLDSITGPEQVLTIDFDTPQSGFGFDTGFGFMTSFDLTINFLSDAAFTGSFSAASGAAFFGFMGDSADITSIVIDGTGGSFNFALDNFTFTDNAASVVPVPAALPLFGTGLAILGFMGWRRRHT